MSEPKRYMPVKSYRMTSPTSGFDSARLQECEDGEAVLYSDYSALQAENKRLKAEVDVLRGVDCEADGDGPCGVCIKCRKAQLHSAEQRLNAEERAHELSIDKRDKAEDALALAYWMVTGREAIWSNLFGYDEAIHDIRAACASAEQRLKEAEAANERDRTTLHRIVHEIDAEIRGRMWLIEGRGCYEWDDDTYCKEFGWAVHALQEKLEPLRKIAGDLKHCPTTEAEKRTALSRG